MQKIFASVCAMSVAKVSLRRLANKFMQYILHTGWTNEKKCVRSNMCSRSRNHRVQYSSFFFTLYIELYIDRRWHLTMRIVLKKNSSWMSHGTSDWRYVCTTNKSCIEWSHSVWIDITMKREQNVKWKSVWLNNFQFITRNACFSLWLLKLTRFINNLYEASGRA